MKYRVALFFSILISIVCCLGFAPVSAHELKTDGSIAAVLHTNPNDAPTSKTSTQYLLWFTDSTGKFGLNACNCTATFKENGKTIATQNLKPVSNLSSANNIVFPTADIYTVSVAGTPLQPGSFQSFALTYMLRVEKGTTDNGEQSFPIILTFGLSVLVTAIMLAAYVFNRSSNNGA